MSSSSPPTPQSTQSTSSKRVSFADEKPSPEGMNISGIQCVESVVISGSSPETTPQVNPLLKSCLSPKIPPPGLPPQEEWSRERGPEYFERTLPPSEDVKSAALPREKQHQPQESQPTQPPAANPSTLPPTLDQRIINERSPLHQSQTGPMLSPVLAEEKANAVLRRRIDLPKDKRRCDHCGELFALADFELHRSEVIKRRATEARRTFLQKFVFRPFIDFFIWLLVHVFFREVAVVGADNIPKTGPVVFYANHQNQFVDAMIIRATCGRALRFIIAEKSVHRPIIGHFARMMDSVPVVRPQDVPSRPGTGKLVRSDCDIVFGSETKFKSELGYGDVMLWSPTPQDKFQAQVVTVISDTEVRVSQPVDESRSIKGPIQFMRSKRIDHSKMYGEVFATFRRGDAIGIFPEGGSHDRTSLLPLKAGVALFSLGAIEEGLFPKIIPCGLTYFYGHKFRSRAHIEFGRPYTPDPRLFETFKFDKRAASGELLHILNAELRAVTINVQDWQTLKLLHAFRKLYQPPSVRLETQDYLRLTRRLSILIKEHHNAHDFQDFRNRVENYVDYCNALLIRDAQCATLGLLKRENFVINAELLARRIIMLVLLGLLLVPFVIVAMPIGLTAHILSDKSAQEALAASTVKVVAADVKASYKLITCFTLVPVVFSVVAGITFSMSDLRTAGTVYLSLPVAMYVSLLIAREFILEFYATLPLVMSMLSKHKQFLRLYDRRTKLVKQAKEIVYKYDPALEGEMRAIQEATEKEAVRTREPSLFSLRHASRRARWKT